MIPKCCKTISPVSSSSKSCKITCPHHLKKPITTFCLADLCKQPYMCAQCLKSHDSSHADSHISASNFFNITAHKHQIDRDAIRALKSKALQILVNLHKELNLLMENLILKTESFFSKLEFTLASNMSRQAEFENLKHKIRNFEAPDITKLVDIYKEIGLGLERLELKPSLVTTFLGNEAKKIIDHFKQQVIPNLESMFEPPKTPTLDFKKLKLDHSFCIPGSNGVGYEATDFIPEWQLLAIGTYHDRKGDLAIWDLNAKELRGIKKNIHEVGITYVRWLPENKLVVTCAYDKLIKVFKLRNQGRDIDHIATLRGHTQRIRCMIAMEDHDMIVTGGDDPDLKMWQIRGKMRQISCISTRGEGMLGSYLLYLKGKKLIGASFKSGKIKFFNFVSKQQVFEFYTDSQGRYPCGLQLLPKKSLMICNTREYMVKMWNLDELNFKIKEEGIIKAEGKEPNCMIANYAEDQILMGCLTPKLEIYDLNTNKMSILDLSGYIKEANSLVYLKSINKISICDRVSGTICILSE